MKRNKPQPVFINSAVLVDLRTKIWSLQAYFDIIFPQ